MSPLAARLLAVALAVAAAVAAVHAGPPPCTTLLQLLIPCTPYITRHGDLVPDACCSVVESMAGMMMTTHADRVAVCMCFQIDVARQMKDLDYGRVAALPSRCHVTAQFDFTPDVKCDEIKAAAGTEAEEHL